MESPRKIGAEGPRAHSEDLSDGIILMLINICWSASGK
jgi:hypothetical protein